MANVVEIVIKVDNAQANSAMAATQAALQQVGVAGNVSMGQLSQGASAAVPAMHNVGQAAQQMGSRITTSLDGVRLMSQEFGFRLPRALESMLSRMPAVTGAIQGMMGAFTGIAVAEVFVQMGEAAYNLYTKYISLTAAATDYSKEVEKHRDEAFVDTHSIEVTTQRIDEATAAVQRFKTEAQQLHEQGLKDMLNGYLDPYHMAKGGTEVFDARDAANNQYKAQAQLDQLQKVKELEDNHRAALDAIDEAHAKDASLQADVKDNAELAKKKAINAENRQYGQARDSIYQGYGLLHGGEAEQRHQDAMAEGEAAASKINRQREVTNKTIEMQNEATNARLAGINLERAQEEEAIAAIKRSGVGTMAEIAAVRAKYHNETMKQIEAETDAVQQRADLEWEAALTGLAKVQSEGQRRIDDVNARQRKGLYADQTAPGAPSKLADQDRATAQAEQLRTMGDAEKQYREQQAQEDQRANSEQLSGFAKIDAEVAASSQKRADEFEKMYGQMAHDSAQYIEGQKALEQSEAVIASSGDRQRAQLEQELRQQTLQQQTEAAQAERRIRGAGIMGWTEDYRRGIAEVQAAEAASIAKINAEQSKSGVTGTAFELYQQQKVVAEQKADAQIQELNQQMAHQIAGVLQGAFEDPVHYIQNLFKKMMFEILANAVAQSKLFGRIIGGGQANAGGGQASAQSSAASGSSGGFGGSIAGALGRFGNSTGGGRPSGNSNDDSKPNPGAFDGSSSPHDVMGPGGGVFHIGAGVMTPGGLASGGAIPSLASMGMSTASTLSKGAADSFNDPTKMSSSVSSSTSAAPGDGFIFGHSLSAEDSAKVDQGFSKGITAGVGAYTGTKGIIGAFEQGSPGGILNGAASGAAMGGAIGMLGGPAGALIGAGIGAAGGAAAGLVGWATGEGGNLAASKYFKEQMRPQMEQAEQAYAKGSGDALSTISTIDGIASTGLAYIGGKYGASSLAWARAAYVDKERIYLEGQINSMAKGGKDYMSRSAAQFHTGGEISDFGDLSLGGGEGFIKTLLGERVANRTASSLHGSEIDMMNNGATPSDMAAHYLKTTGGTRTQASQASSGDTHHWNVNAIDASSFEKFLTHGGGMTAVARATNRYSSQYSGDASHG